MKKIALTSLLAVVAASAAHASINVIDGNPMVVMNGHWVKRLVMVLPIVWRFP